MPAKTPLASDKIDAPVLHAPFHFVDTAGVL